MHDALRIEPLTDAQKARIRYLYKEAGIHATNLQEQFMVKDLTTIFQIINKK